jgi:putative selenate reductase
MELVPQPLANLIRRIEREPRASKQGEVFDLPRNKMWRGAPAGLDFSRRFHGERAANVVGPAAGPHTQLAQNIALSYLAGARILELKTVQILDELKIPRPCIDVANVGYNVEWSQELRIHQSREEYAKAALLIALLRRLGHPQGLAPGPDEDYLLDLSLGYDLKGISSEAVTGFVRDMLDASPMIDRLLGALPPDLARYRDLSVNPKLISCVTLSTFHGCPANEIEKIARYLLEELSLHVVVKLNPTLLGYDELTSVLHDHLGYRDLRVRRETFDKDLQWGDALAMIGRLRGVAKRMGRAFGVKLTNTLVVDNHKSFFTEKEMYLSGQPLHVLSSRLYRKLREALPLVGEGGEPPVEYSFSAGIDQHNFPLAVAADLHPVTTCTDLLRPGGYGRLPRYLENLGDAMRAASARDIETFILRAHGHATAAMEAAADAIAGEAARRGMVGPADVRSALLSSADELMRDRSRDPVACLLSHGISGELADLTLELWIHQAGTLNAACFAQAAHDDPRYRRDANIKLPKKIGSTLELFDCINCDKCIPVCPNDANFVYEVAPLATSARTWTFENGRVRSGDMVPFAIEQTHQLATFVDFCNACGNCDVFCPEDGGPYVMKPHWFGSRASFLQDGRLDGFYLESKDIIVGRIRGEEVRLTVDRAARRLLFESELVEASLRMTDEGIELTSHRHKQPDEPCEVNGGHILVMAALLDGIQATVNPVSAALT